ncbi:hypothetical protein BDP27DRAFT_1339895 [Rhodocollybia butyracea]|uniref:Uncharacterized protein n=1 Tax=Rhodocollybia butyracea TaxID=206335 RepID=A0A9P5PAI0_9AGAR|nr:hypothetical protein BDP27DRAFT_1339895 [Rhodocollybia butyracea]
MNNQGLVYSSRFVNSSRIPIESRYKYVLLKRWVLDLTLKDFYEFFRFRQLQRQPLAERFVISSRPSTSMNLSSNIAGTVSNLYLATSTQPFPGLSLFLLSSGGSRISAAQSRARTGGHVSMGNVGDVRDDGKEDRERRERERTVQDDPESLLAHLRERSRETRNASASTLLRHLFTSFSSPTFASNDPSVCTRKPSSVFLHSDTLLHQLPYRYPYRYPNALSYMGSNVIDASVGLSPPSSPLGNVISFPIEGDPPQGQGRGQQRQDEEEASVPLYPPERVIPSFPPTHSSRRPTDVEAWLKKMNNVFLASLEGLGGGLGLGL